jgi:hypothetical protein
MFVIVPGRGRCWESPVLSDSETPAGENIFTTKWLIPTGTQNDEKKIIKKPKKWAKKC